MECCRVVCHGPIERKGLRVTAVTCSANCNGYWHHSLKRGVPLAWRYQDLRVCYAFWRELKALKSHVKRASFQAAASLLDAFEAV